MGARSLSKWRIVENARGEKISGDEYNEREGARERKRERHVGRKKETGRSRCVSVHSRRNQVPRCVLPRTRRGRSGGSDVGGSGRIDRVWAATNPRFSSLPFVDPFFLSSPLIHAPGTFLSSPSSIRLSPFRLAFFVSPAFSFFSLDSTFVLPSCISFHRSVLMLFLRLPFSPYLPPFLLFFIVTSFSSFSSVSPYLLELISN